MLSKKLKNESVNGLLEFLNKPRKRKLSKKKKEAIKKEIKRKRKKNKEFAEKLVDSPLFKLAKTQLMREGKAERVEYGSKQIYEVKPNETLLKMFDIVNTAHKENKKELLDQYTQKEE